MQDCDYIVRKEIDRLYMLNRKITESAIAVEHKALFLATIIERGIRNEDDVIPLFEDISKNYTDTIGMFFEEKLIGIETARNLAVNYDEECHKKYYNAVKKHGVKSEFSELVIVGCGGDVKLGNLFEGVDDE